jgi:nitrate reductase NapE component
MTEHHTQHYAIGLVELDNWLQTATRGLCKEAQTRIREEIVAHYRQAFDDAFDCGESEEYIPNIAVATLGNPHIAGRAFRRNYFLEGEYDIALRSLKPRMPRLKCSFIAVLFMLFGIWKLHVIVQMFRGGWGDISWAYQWLLGGLLWSIFIALPALEPWLWFSKSRNLYQLYRARMDWNWLRCPSWVILYSVLGPIPTTPQRFLLICLPITFILLFAMRREQLKTLCKLRHMPHHDPGRKA